MVAYYKMVKEREEIIEITFMQLGLRKRKSIFEHLLLENAFENNLLSDISEVDYINGHNGETELQEIQNNDVFVDDIYLYFYMSDKDIIKINGIVQCTTGDRGSAKDILERVYNAIKQTLTKDYPEIYTHANIIDTVSLTTNKNKGIIRETIKSIEEEDDTALENWKKNFHKRRARCYCYCKNRCFPNSNFCFRK